MLVHWALEDDDDDDGGVGQSGGDDDGAGQSGGHGGDDSDDVTSPKAFSPFSFSLPLLCRGGSSAHITSSDLPLLIKKKKPR